MHKTQRHHLVGSITILAIAISHCMRPNVPTAINGKPCYWRKSRKCYTSDRMLKLRLRVFVGEYVATSEQVPNKMLNNYSRWQNGQFICCLTIFAILIRCIYATTRLYSKKAFFSLYAVSIPKRDQPKMCAEEQKCTISAMSMKQHHILLKFFTLDNVYFFHHRDIHWNCFCSKKARFQTSPFFLKMHYYFLKLQFY